MLSRSNDSHSLLSSKELGLSQYSDTGHRVSTNQHDAPGRIPGIKDKESGTTTAAQIGGRKEKEVQVPTGYRRLPTEPGLSMARYSAFHQATQLKKLFWIHRQQTRYLKLCFFFREQPRSQKRKTRRGGQCHRGLQRPDDNTLTEPLNAPLARNTAHDSSLCVALHLLVEVGPLPHSVEQDSQRTLIQAGSTFFCLLRCMLLSIFVCRPSFCLV
ncbi:uncharacterized protein LOC143816737 [Ranitomeya variabilis]|uniref:uncharacterized protein LOC143765204 n=1 Tax=Ranitomeya variabilis TaxID=490064 RepID=UPI004057313D